MDVENCYQRLRKAKLIAAGTRTLQLFVLLYHLMTSAALTPLLAA
jgi:hypothetical protein